MFDKFQLEVNGRKITRIIPRANFTEGWKENDIIVDKNELILIMQDKGVPSMRIGDGKTRATKCRMVSPFAFLDIVDGDEPNSTQIIQRKGKNEYKWLRAYVRAGYVLPDWEPEEQDKKDYELKRERRAARLAEQGIVVQPTVRRVQKKKKKKKRRPATTTTKPQKQ